MTAVLFGSISTVADTSELQRQAFNSAFTEHGLGWDWSQEQYRLLLNGNGGAQRIADYAHEQGTEVDAEAVHGTKSLIFQESLARETVRARPGVAESIKGAKLKGYKVGLVTTTSRANISALLSAVANLSAEDFDLIVDVTSVDKPKPAADAYVFALTALGESASSAIAVEDNPGGVQAALAAGITCVAFPNTNTADGDFSGAWTRVDAIDLDALERAIAGP